MVYFVATYSRAVCRVTPWWRLVPAVHMPRPHVNPEYSPHQTPAQGWIFSQSCLENQKTLKPIVARKITKNSCSSNYKWMDWWIFDLSNWLLSKLLSLLILFYSLTSPRLLLNLQFYIRENIHPCGPARCSPACYIFPGHVRCSPDVSQAPAQHHGDTHPPLRPPQPRHRQGPGPGHGGDRGRGPQGWVSSRGVKGTSRNNKSFPLLIAPTSTFTTKTKPLIGTDQQEEDPSMVVLQSLCKFAKSCLQL